MKTALVLMAVVALLGGCSHCCRRGATQDPAAAPESALVDGRELRLSAELWRDFQPMAPPDGQGLMAALSIGADDGLPLPGDVAISGVWVLNDKERWAPAFSGPAGMLVANLTDGPKWAPGTQVDVVVRLTRDKQAWLLRAAGVPIRRTD